MGMLLDSIFGFPRSPVQRVYMWDCIMPDIGGAGVPGIVISKYCQSITIGEYNIDDIAEMKVAALKQFFAGSMNIQNPSATFVVPVPDIISNYLHSWKKLIVDNRGFYHRAGNYKKNIYVVLYDRSCLPSNMITLVGTYPKSFPSWNLAYGTEEVVKYEIEFKVDNIETGVSSFSSLGSVAEGVLGSVGKMVSSFF